MYSADKKNHANMDAAQSTPTTLEMARLRRRSRASGTRGAATRDSMAANTASSTADAPSRPSDCAEVQPASLPLTMAYTASISAAVTVTAPAQSSRCPLAWPLPPGNSTRQAA